MVAIERAVRRQSAIMGYGDAFFLLGVALLLVLVAVLCLRKSDRSGAVAAH